MAKNRRAREGGGATRRGAPPEIRKWALLIALAVSLALHILLGVGVSNLIRLQKARFAPAPEDSVSVRLVAVAPKAPIAEKAATAKKTPEIAITKTIPKAPPRPIEPQTTPPPRPVKKAEKRRPTKRVVPRREAHAVPPKLPERQAAPGAGNPVLKRTPAPLPRGRREGDKILTRPQPEPRVAPPQTSPLPAKAPNTEGGRPAASPVAVVKAETPVPAAPTTTAPPSLAPSEKDGAATGAGSGVGGADAIGINRGIPFGDALGITHGGSPNGGGGIGRGAGGSGGAGRGLGGMETYVRPAPRFTLARPSRTDEGPPLHIVYVIDISGSMEDGGKIRRVRDAMDKALGELRDEDYFNIVYFSDKAFLFSPTMRAATQSNVGAGVLSVGVATPGGATNLSAALDLAFGQPDVTHIFLMSDGEPTEGVTDFSRIEALARARNTHNAHILTLALGRGEKFKGMTLLRQLAVDGRGTFNYIDLSKQ